MLAPRLACVSTTPLGAAVDPDVNCSSAGAFGDVGAGSGREGPARRSSIEYIGGVLARSPVASNGATSANVITALARLAARMWRDCRAKVGKSPACAGGQSGTG